jgi:hypothetical protein
MARILAARAAARAAAVCPWRFFLLQPISGVDPVLISKNIIKGKNKNNVTSLERT